MNDKIMGLFVRLEDMAQTLPRLKEVTINLFHEVGKLSEEGQDREVQDLRKEVERLGARYDEVTGLLASKKEENNILAARLLAEQQEVCDLLKELDAAHPSFTWDGDTPEQWLRHLYTVIKEGKTELACNQINNVLMQNHKSIAR